jgi:hypothetical protein
MAAKEREQSGFDPLLRNPAGDFARDLDEALAFRGNG